MVPSRWFRSHSARVCLGRAMTSAPDDLPSVFEIEFYKAPDGSKPVLDWIKNDLSPTKRRALGSAMRRILQQHGVQVCRNHWGKKVHPDGLYEFRVRMTGRQVLNLQTEIHGTTEHATRTRLGIDTSEEILLRVFFHPHGDKILLLLGGYDKGQDPNAKRQQTEIKLALGRLTAWKQTAHNERTRPPRRP